MLGCTKKPEVIFTDDNLILKADREKHFIKEKDFTVNIGSVEEFSNYMYDCAFRNGYGKYQNTVIVSDGLHCSNVFDLSGLMIKKKEFIISD